MPLFTKNVKFVLIKYQISLDMVVWQKCFPKLFCRKLFYLSTIQRYINYDLCICIYYDEKIKVNS